MSQSTFRVRSAIFRGSYLLRQADPGSKSRQRDIECRADDRAMFQPKAVIKLHRPGAAVVQ